MTFQDRILNVTSLVVTLSALGAAACYAENGEPQVPPKDEPALQEDLRSVEGTWKRTFRDKQGRELTTIKTEADGVSTVTIRDSDDRVLHRHRSEFTVERTGDVRVFRYWNRMVTDGPDAGKLQAGPFRYIYRVHKERFIEIHGMLLDDERSPSVLVWERVPDPPKGDL